MYMYMYIISLFISCLYLYLCLCLCLNLRIQSYIKHPQKIENGAAPSGKSYTKVNFPAADVGKAEVQITANGAAKDTKAKIDFGSLVKGADFVLR